MKIFVIGSGNVAFSLGRVLYQAGHTITGVCSTNPETGQDLSHQLQCAFFSNASAIPAGSDVYLLAVNDDSIEAVAGLLPRMKGLTVHTSGSTPMDLLGNRRRGVLYPLESITREHPASFRHVPLCIEGSDTAAKKLLMELAASISGSVHVVDSEKRAQLHLAAVIVNNFTNHLLRAAFELTGKEKNRHKLLEELARSTIRNAFGEGPERSQTGPARRGDRKTIEKHLMMLRASPETLALYKMFTKQIAAAYGKTRK
jgi:predicted short-subunit dehydrogenase-like oxidoreductase (DUF2520 family)